MFASGCYLDDSVAQVSVWHLEGPEESVVGWMTTPPQLHVWDVWATLGCIASC